MSELEHLLRYLSRLWVLYFRIGYSTSLCVLDGVDVVIVATADREEREQDSESGIRYPAYCTASGKVLLSSLCPDERADLVSRMILASRSPRTVTSERELLDRLRYLGDNHDYIVGVNEEEFGPGELAVACPIYTADGSVIPALSQAAHADDTSWEEFIERVFIPLSDEAAAISSLLGYEQGRSSGGLSTPLSS